MKLYLMYGNESTGVSSSLREHPVLSRGTIAVPYGEQCKVFSRLTNNVLFLLRELGRRADCPLI